MALRSRVTVAVLTLVTALSAFSGPGAQEPARHDARVVPPQEVLAGMSWLAGSWAGEMWGGRFVAYYSTPEGGQILGHSKLIKDDREAFYEFELFEARETTVWLQPFPGGKKADGFPLLSHDPQRREAIFENPDKDFPTRIVYRRVSDDELSITLSDPHGGSDEVERFELRR